jgi:glycerol uptake facilitator-like aquaporin
VRAYAYFLGFIIAFQVSGAMFNPATSLAVLITDRQCKNFIGFLIMVIVQFAGSFAGIFVTYLLTKYYTTVELYPDLSIIKQQGDTTYLLYFDSDGDPIWGRLILQEILHSFTFTLVYLIVKYDKSMKRVDRLSKAFCLTFTLMVSFYLTLGSGASFNPAFALA